MRYIAPVGRVPARRYAPLVARLALAALAMPVLAPAAPDATPPGTGNVDLEWEVRVPLRDGTTLGATIYHPSGAHDPRPCVFTLTPYVRDSYHDRGLYFARHGIPFVTVDARGRGTSGGTFRPLIQEAADGYDVVEWLARQPYCNGKVAMWGGSYAGYDQWVTAAGRPPHLATIVPVASPTAGVDFPARNNTFAPYDMQWLTFTSGKAVQQHLFEDDAYWRTANLRFLESGAAFRALDRVLGNPSATYQEWLAHPDLDAYWDSYNPTAAQYAALTLPILTITGMYDDDQPGAIAHYERYMQAASPAGRARHYLVIGPWDHPGTRTPKAEFLGLKFGPASLVDLPQLHLDWYRYAMEGGPLPSFLRKPVAYYVSGAEQWRYADTLESVTARSEAFYLDSRGDEANDLYHAGSLVASGPARGAPDAYHDDPRDLARARVEAGIDTDSILDQRSLLANPAKLVYLSAPFTRDEELSGFFRLEAWLAIDQADTDFVVTVSEVAADGTILRLSSDVQRARYRESLRAPKPVTTREPLRYDFSRFTFASRLVRQGSRLMVCIAAANSLFDQRNYNTGGTVADETRADARPVTVRLYHDAKHRSALYVPYATPAPVAAHAS